MSLPVTRHPTQFNIYDHRTIRRGVPPLDATALAQQQFPIPSSERLEHSQLGPMMTAGLTESEERRGLILHDGRLPIIGGKGFPSPVGASPNTADR